MIENNNTTLDWAERTVQLIGESDFEKLKKSSVLIVGLGGVGGAAAEMICRAGVGNMALIDFDKIQHSNINRQLIATHETVGYPKTEILSARLKQINPDLQVTIISEALDDTNTEKILSSGRFDYVVDAIDTITPKVSLLKYCVENEIKVVSSMGSGAKMAPELVRVDDISKSKYCKLARPVRKRLHKFGITKGIQVVYSTEVGDKNNVILTNEWHKKSITGTISYMPTLFGLYLSSIVIRGIIKEEKND